ncbi:pantetheine-phosphate adenylyltransferase [Rapidithrix thailandica]|uniref:Phosphopantetheine adenylyltransferase n=1 Tax=Rapidithrix thailandica TaxID=413964 RepID=A0AAW9RWT3_9BACT
MKKIAVFPGSFDPFTNGHADIALRASMLFDEVIIGIGHNSKKKRYFPLDFMIRKIEETFQDNDRVKVEHYNELTASYAQKRGAQFLVRGLRNTTDFEYENSIAQANKHIYGNLETIFIITSPQYAHISSTIVREIHNYGQNINEFLPYDL